jgi:diguanylate cyclase (GGDEF)-like protein/PAS domain S-box-containing protein
LAVSGRQLVDAATVGSVQAVVGGRGVKRYQPHILVACLLVLAFLTGARGALQDALTDLRFRAFPRQASGDLVLVAIDSPSIREIGVWPWPRTLHADLIDKLRQAGASDILFDVDFSSPSNPAADQSLLEALKRASGSVGLAAFKQPVNGEAAPLVTPHVNRPLPQFAEHAWPALVNVAVEPSGVVRRYSLGETLNGEFLPSIGGLLAGSRQTHDGPLLIDFSIRANSIAEVSYADILRGDPAAIGQVNGKKALIGGTAIELGDRFNTPNGRVISGALLHALAAETMLQDRTMQTSSGIFALLGVALIAMVAILSRRRLPLSIQLVALMSVAVAAELGAMLLQAKYAIVLDTSLWHIAVAGYLLAMAVDEIDLRGLLRSAEERRFQEIAMSLGDGLVCTDQSNRITVWNPAATAIFGYSKQEMLGQPLGRICRTSSAEWGGPFSIPDALRVAPQGADGRLVELTGLCKTGETFPLEACLSSWRGIDGFQYGAALRDISARKQEADRMRHLAEHDTLTGLANRNRLYEHLGIRLAEARTQRTKVALLLLDLDKFKQVNDTLGHAAGDQLLCAVARRLDALVENAGLVARLSGDEFAIVVSGAAAVEQAASLAERACRTFDHATFSIGENELRVKASIGVATYPDHCMTADELFGDADLALYRAKATGRGRHVTFTQAIRDEVEARLTLEIELGYALERNELELFYQPQVRLSDGALLGAEALVRWRHPSRGLLSPADFMPLVNISSISARTSLWIMETACRQGRAWQQAGHGIRLGVNIPPSLIQSGDLASTIEGVLKDTEFPPSLLELEVTEDILLEDDERALATFLRVQKLGVQIAFDDFGTGYASLTYLKKFPINRLKIDKSFVHELRAGSNDAAIVICTITLANLLGLSVIAEGVEDATSIDLLRGMGCEEGQGFHFAPPLPAAEFARRYLPSLASADDVEILMRKPAATAA